MFKRSTGDRGQQSSVATSVRTVQSFRDLQVWKKAHALALRIYQVTQEFPREEQYGLTSQMRRASVSTAANIVEGSKRRTRRDFSHFLNQAQGSKEELKYFILLAGDLNYFSSEVRTELDAGTNEIGAMLFAFVSKLNSVAL